MTVLILIIGLMFMYYMLLKALYHKCSRVNTTIQPLCLSTNMLILTADFKGD